MVLLAGMGLLARTRCQLDLDALREPVAFAAGKCSGVLRTPARFGTYAFNLVRFVFHSVFAVSKLRAQPRILRNRHAPHRLGLRTPPPRRRCRRTHGCIGVQREASRKDAMRPASLVRAAGSAVAV